MKEILDVIHKTIYQFFDICEDDEEVPMSDKDKLLLEVNKAICNNLKTLEHRQRWIPVSERLPEKHGDYLVTIENGDVFNCYFNPDYCYDGYDNGAFTYTKEYFDHETMGSLGSEEFVVDDVVAWTSYEPYKAESEDV